MTTIETLQGEFKKAQDTLNRLEKEIKDFKKEDNNPVIFPKANEKYYALKEYRGADEGWKVDISLKALNNRTDPYFRTEEAAKDYGHAFLTLLKLRAQPGVVEARTGKSQCIIISDGAQTLRVDTSNMTFKYFCLSPAFKDKESAEAAINVVGKEDILKAIKTLSWSE